jgi:hypothetical protein
MSMTFAGHLNPNGTAQCLVSGSKRRNRARELALSEIVTILILFHRSHYRTFKAFYTEHVCVELRGEFPCLVSYIHLVQVEVAACIRCTGYPGQPVAQRREAAGSPSSTAIL